jgi:DNA-binding CsgD family transcriptional regulator
MGRSLPAEPKPPDTDLVGRIRQLILLSANGPSDIVLDVRVEGYRCILMRERDNTWRERAVLSPREQEIARMVAKGMPNKSIARVLDISTWTVGTYLRRIFAKLGVTSRAAMVAAILESESSESFGPARFDHSLIRA